MKALLITLLLIGPFPASANINPACQAGMAALFNGRLAESASLIDEAIRIHPEEPGLYFVKAEHAFYSRYFNPQPLSRDSMLTLVMVNATRAVKLVEEGEPTIENLFLLGSAYGLLSRVHIMRQEFWEGYWTARHSRNSLDEVIAKDPDYFDAYAGLGVLEYYSDRLTGFQAGLAWLGGIAGDREKGLEHFRKTAEYGSLLKDEATFILAFLYRSIETNYLLAGEYYGRLHRRHPGNEFFATQFRQSSLGALVEERGADWLVEHLDTLREEFDINSSDVLNGLGYGLIGRQEYASALAVFRVNLELYPTEANPYDSMSECCALMGNRDEAIRYSRLCLERLEQDTTIEEEFRENLRNISMERLKELDAGPGV